MNSSSFASNFAPYTPPPDDANRASSPTAAGSSRIRPWFPPQDASSGSYQSGGLPTFSNSYTAISSNAEPEGQVNVWETRFGTRVDVLAAFAYVLGPISALLLLILETHNDYVRFHAYQSALATTPLVLLRIFGALVHFPVFLNTIITLWIIVTQVFAAFRAYMDASQGLTRFYIPHIGLLAEQWVAEE